MKTNGQIEFVSADGVKKTITDIDEQLNKDSTNPIANSAVCEALADKADNLIATAEVAGLVKLGDDAVQEVDANPITATVDRSYAVQLNSAGQMVVNVPWENTQTTVTVDDELSLSSVNPVQNKIVTKAIQERVSKNGDTINGDLNVTDTVTATTFKSSGEYLRVITKDDNDKNKVFGIKGSNADVYNLQTMRSEISEAYSPDNPPPVQEAACNTVGAVYGVTETELDFNTCLGYNARTQVYGAPNGKLRYNVVIGYNATVTTSLNDTYVNNIVIGYGAGASVSNNKVQIGNSNISTANIKVSWTVTSDERDKADITEIDNGKALEFICAVEPIQYVDNDREKYLLREKKTVTLDDGTVTEEYDENGENERVYQQYGMCEYDREAHARGDKKGERKRIGVKAQQVQSLLQDIFGSDNYANLVNDNFYDLRANDNEPPVENHLSVAYERFVPFLIAAIKQQQVQIDALEKRIYDLERK